MRTWRVRAGNVRCTRPDSLAQLDACSFAGTRSYCAWQMVGPQGTQVDEAVTLGRSYGCRYFEIYAEDVTAYANTLPAL